MHRMPNPLRGLFAALRSIYWTMHVPARLRRMSERWVPNSKRGNRPGGRWCVGCHRCCHRRSHLPGHLLTPAGMARSLGSPALLAGVWCGMAVLTLPELSALLSWLCAIRRPAANTSTSATALASHRLSLRMDGRRGHVSRSSGGPVCWVSSICSGARPLPGWLAAALPALILISLGAINFAGTTPLQRLHDHAQLAQGSRSRWTGWLGARFRPSYPGQPCSIHPAARRF